jgi:hypothetical protein
MIPLNKKGRKVLIEGGWNTDYPKHPDLMWKQQSGKGIYTNLDNQPPFVLECVNINRANVDAHKKREL